jgi:hypothetical protein
MFLLIFEFKSIPYKITLGDDDDDDKIKREGMGWLVELNKKKKTTEI